MSNPPARYDAGQPLESPPSEVQWEYDLIAVDDTRRLMTELNTLGEQGWEVVGYSIISTNPGFSHYALLGRRRT
jgi:hypothetical protein